MAREKSENSQKKKKHALCHGKAISLKVNEAKKCPKCGGELEKGVMQASFVVFWNKDDIEEHLTSVWRLSRRNTLESQAWRCKKCQLAIFYYGKYKDEKP
jgi:uncharacterized protein with PIN domain